VTIDARSLFNFWKAMARPNFLLSFDWSGSLRRRLLSLASCFLCCGGEAAWSRLVGRILRCCSGFVVSLLLDLIINNIKRYKDTFTPPRRVFKLGFLL